ncbi:hypothetical protein IMG5_061310 [Ichthyophthirius multifiliis]|uniref:Uncharacterized protein n=1 Tax=Ichthyophthirius multifiliis TaxID=5932 RepID=G0QNU1_ICHMU|nr:hypothetical protein IMG5_061310 [Ichthyophthirius multifiliis]EGR33132.1 hypothetical protein IMG5_061310 [Ichthyophthirius multifiliis]|eukprot:XP_004037118.1 hypothetical protein IMG5_061310 [Ichthyophthirius multifiliis]
MLKEYYKVKLNFKNQTLIKALKIKLLYVQPPQVEMEIFFNLLESKNKQKIWIKQMIILMNLQNNMIQIIKSLMMLKFCSMNLQNNTKILKIKGILIWLKLITLKPMIIDQMKNMLNKTCKLYLQELKIKNSVELLKQKLLLLLRLIVLLIKFKQKQQHLLLFMLQINVLSQKIYQMINHQMPNIIPDTMAVLLNLLIISKLYFHK